MSLWTEVAPRLAAGDELSYEESRQVMALIMSGQLDEIKLSAFLSMTAVRGVTVHELQGLADQMQASAETVDLPAGAVDIVGTGGDGAKTVNVSTMAAIVIAASGFPVVKHGNRASTSACGSADLLEALGVDLNLSTQDVERSYREAGIAFLFANKFHPSMRHAARVRRELGFPTAFNVLGPLANPARPRASAVGVAKESAAPLVAGVFANRGTSAFVFRGRDLGLDELSTIEPAQIWTVQRGQVRYTELDFCDLLGVPRASVDALRGGDAAYNAEVARNVLAGSEGPITQAVALNAAVGMMAGAAAGLAQPELQGEQVFASTDWLEEDALLDGFRRGFEMAHETLSSGDALEKLQSWVSATQDI